jgi:hypothetical protein
MVTAATARRVDSPSTSHRTQMVALFEGRGNTSLRRGAYRRDGVHLYYEKRNTQDTRLVKNSRSHGTVVTFGKRRISVSLNRSHLNPTS